MRRTILILGGTKEARRLAEAVSRDSRFDAAISLAGRTRDPLPLPLPTRVGGFGGIDGLTAYLKEKRVAALVVATHPYAAAIAGHAAAAAERSGVPVLRLDRPAWIERPGDIWRRFPTLDALADAIGPAPRNVLVTTGRSVAAFERAPQHRYWFRSVDPIEPPPELPQCHFLLDRGPFAVAGEQDLMRLLGIETLVTKDSGGDATYAKIEAARELGIEVLLLDRPPPRALAATGDVEGVLAWLDQLFGPAPRGE